MVVLSVLLAESFGHMSLEDLNFDTEGEAAFAAAFVGTPLVVANYFEYGSFIFFSGSAYYTTAVFTDKSPSHVIKEHPRPEGTTGIWHGHPYDLPVEISGHIDAFRDTPGLHIFTSFEAGLIMQYLDGNDMRKSQLFSGCVPREHPGSMRPYTGDPA